MLFNNLELPPTADFHVHLRDGQMMELVTPTITQGGVDTVYVMPNLQPPITTVAAALSYRDRLQALAPEVTFLMSLYLHPSVTPQTVADAALAGITGVKMYPAGVTTGSQDGVLDYQGFYPVFEAMEKHDMILNLHGEVPSTADSSSQYGKSPDSATVLNAEVAFLPTLFKLHRDFPRLRIVLEHCTTAHALEAVRACGPTVRGTITAHHLWLTIDDVCGDAVNFCKPVAKTPVDRVALVRAVVEGSNKFFFGSDSAPHPIEAKATLRKPAAGCFTQSWATALVIAGVEEGLKKGWVQGEVTPKTLASFLGTHGREFYGVAQNPNPRKILLERKGEYIPRSIKDTSGNLEVIPFRAGEEVLSVSWL